MKRALLCIALLAGCSTMPYRSNRTFWIAEGVNTAAIAGATICAEECHGAAAGISVGLLATELAVTAFAVTAVGVAIANSGGL